MLALLTVAITSKPSRQKCSPGQCELVVSYCHEPLNWIKTFQDGQEFKRVVIYSKCGVNITAGTIPNSTVVKMDNIGSCDGVYLRHVVNFYSDLAPIILFCKGSLPNRCGMHTLIEPDRAWSRDTWRVFTSAGHMNQGFFRFDLPASDPGVRKIVHRIHVANFSQPTYRMAARATGVDTDLLCYYRSGYPNLRSWLAGVIGEWKLAEDVIDAGQGVVLGGHFAAERSLLIRYPRSFYAAVAAMQRHANEEIDHFMERMWGLLLTAPEAVALPSSFPQAKLLELPSTHCARRIARQYIPPPPPPSPPLPAATPSTLFWRLFHRDRV